MQKIVEANKFKTFSIKGSAKQRANIMNMGNKEKKQYSNLEGFFLSLISKINLLMGTFRIEMPIAEVTKKIKFVIV